jgi:hypothetical protein
MENILGIENIKIAFTAIVGMAKELKGAGLDLPKILFSLRKLLPVRFKKLKAELQDLTQEETQEIIDFLSNEIPAENIQKALDTIKVGERIKLIKIIELLINK